MKKIFGLIFAIILFLPISRVSAADEYWCMCTTPPPTKCTQYQTKAELVNSCPKDCSQQISNTCATAAQPGSKPSSDPSLQTVKLDNPIGSNTGSDTEITTILGNIITAALGIMGGLVLLMIVWGGFTWLTGMGNPEKIKAGTNTITWAVLGAVVVLGSYFLLNLVLKAISGGL